MKIGINHIVIFCLVSISCKLSAQGLTEAYDLQKGKKYSEAITAYSIFLASDTDSTRKPFIYEWIGVCYDSLGEKIKAKDYYRFAVKEGELDYSFRKRRTAIKLADIFIAEKRFDSAIYYLKYTASLRSVRNLCGSNRIENRTPFYHRMMLAYEGLGQIDSAINVFLPYAFQEWTNNEGTEYATAHIFEDDYHCQLLDFLKVIHKKYPAAYINGQVCQLIDNSEFRVNKENTSSGCTLWIEQRVNFLGKNIYTGGFGIGCSPDPARAADDHKFFKDIFMKELQHSLIYMLRLSSPGL